VLVGRALHRMVARRRTTAISRLPADVSERDAGMLPREKVCLICTGSQGEPRAALARLAQGETATFSCSPATR
jgi:ribonuclease J